MWELDHKEGWEPKYWCFWIVVLKMTLESGLGSKEIKPSNPKGNQRWIFIGMTDAEAEAPVLWLPDTKSRFIGKDPDAGKDWGQEEKGATENEVVEWCHQPNGHEFEQTPGDGKDRECWVLQSLELQRVWHNWVTNTFIFTYYIKHRDLCVSVIDPV